MAAVTQDSVLVRLIRSVSAIKGAKKAAEVLLAQGRDHLESEAQTGVAEILGSEMWRSLPGKGKQAFAAMGGAEGMAAYAVTHQASSLGSAIDSASLVFMHAILEDVLLQCLFGTMRADPAAWEGQIKDRSVKASEIKGKTYDEIRSELLEKHNVQVEHLSLPRKAECLIGILRPPREQLCDAAYVYSKERLEEITSTRNALVHETGPRAISTIKDDLRYMEATAYRFLTATALRYDDEELFDKLLGLPSARQSA